ncbi:MAG: calcium-binding EGF-like domain-containing protein [Chitinophagales bacterium]|nr:calcium-binding EGF-like domain-containing protein [Chitinophagales bacterium]
MKKIIPFFLILFVAITGCKDKCQDSFCPNGYTCVDGVCTYSNGCPIGYEGDDCSTESNAKFAGDYNTTYTGTGGLSNSAGTTIASVEVVNGTPNKIRIDVALNVNADIVGTPLDLPLNVSIEGEVEGDTYSVPSTTLTFEISGVPIPISITYEVEGTKVSENQLNSTLKFTGLVLNGTIEMEGTK